MLYIIQISTLLGVIWDLKFIFKKTCIFEISLLYLQTNIKLKHMSQNVIMAILRHGLTFVGGILIAKGVLSESSASEISGLIMTAVGTIWSIVEKVKASK